jgi:CheY-like chemotaxis protein
MNRNTYLLIDDDPIISLVHRDTILSVDPDAVIIEKSTGRVALSFFESIESFPDYILLDINMPEMNGFEFLNQLYKIAPKSCKNVKVYLLTSSVNPRDLDQMKEYDCILDCVSKPLTTRYLTQVLSNN